MSNNIYKTSNLALCPFLVSNGLEYIGYDTDPDDAKKVIFIFRDPHNRARDMEMLFPRSQEHEYHSLWGYFRSQLARALKNINKKEE